MNLSRSLFFYCYKYVNILPFLRRASVVFFFVFFFFFFFFFVFFFVFFFFFQDITCYKCSTICLKFK